MIDLDRLREAMRDWDMDQAVSVHPVFAVGVAVLAAPTVWWCAVSEYVWVGNAASTARDHCDSEHPSGCGWVALVPVSGGEG